MQLKQYEFRGTGDIGSFESNFSRHEMLDFIIPIFTSHGIVYNGHEFEHQPNRKFVILTGGGTSGKVTSKFLSQFKRGNHNENKIS